MTVVHLANGDDAREVETGLIQLAMSTLGGRCVNRVADSRGVSPHAPSFVYICSIPKGHSAGLRRNNCMSLRRKPE